MSKFNFLTGEDTTEEIVNSGALDDKEASLPESKPEMEDGVSPEEDGVAPESKIDCDMKELTEMCHDIDEFIRNAKAYRAAISKYGMDSPASQLFFDTGFSSYVDRANKGKDVIATESLVKADQKAILSAIDIAVEEMEAKKEGILGKIGKK